MMSETSGVNYLEKRMQETSGFGINIISETSGVKYQVCSQSFMCVCIKT
jgi:hypothetical protein